MGQLSWCVKLPFYSLTDGAAEPPAIGPPSTAKRKPSDRSSPAETGGGEGPEVPVEEMPGPAHQFNRYTGGSSTVLLLNSYYFLSSNFFFLLVYCVVKPAKPLYLYIAHTVQVFQVMRTVPLFHRDSLTFCVSGNVNKMLLYNSHNIRFIIWNKNAVE